MITWVIIKICLVISKIEVYTNNKKSGQRIFFLEEKTYKMKIAV